MTFLLRSFLILCSIQQWGARWLRRLVAFLVSSLLVSAAYSGVSSIFLSEGDTPWSGVLLKILIRAAVMAACVLGCKIVTACSCGDPDTEFLRRLGERYPRGYFVEQWCTLATQVLGSPFRMIGESEGSLLPTAER